MGILRKKKPKADPPELVLAGRKISDVLSEYQKLSEDIKERELRKKALSDTIKDYVAKTGSGDPNGNYFAVSGKLEYGRLVKRKVTINQEKAIKYFKSVGLLGDVTKMVIDEDAVDKLISCGVLTQESLEPICDVNEQYQVSVKLKDVKEDLEEFPEVVVTKSKLKRRR